MLHSATATHNHRDELDIVAADHRVTPTAIRDHVTAAVHDAARDHDGLVSIATIRPLLPAWATGPQVGATVCALVRAGRLEWTGEYTESGDQKNRNATRAVRVYRLTQSLDTEAAA